MDIALDTATTDLVSGKGHRDENFPVASVLLKPAVRAPIMAFYRFARAADDIADHATASPEEKLAGLRAMHRGLDGAIGGRAEALKLARVMRERGLDPVHARDLLEAFEQDVTVASYATWESLIGYCRLSAMPVGRFVLDLHGEDRGVWPANDALCAALQIVNHLQDCGKDYRQIGRVYIPGQTLAGHGAAVEELARPSASPALLATIHETAERTRALLVESRPFAAHIRDRRLAAEVRIIQRLAEDLTEQLLVRDPLSERVHHGKLRAAWLALGALVRRR